MTAQKQILVVCDGFQGEGCPTKAFTRVCTDNPTHARKELDRDGWLYIRYTNDTTHNVRHYDVCPQCQGR